MNFREIIVGSFTAAALSTGADRVAGSNTINDAALDALNQGRGVAHAVPEYQEIQTEGIGVSTIPQLGLTTGEAESLSTLFTSESPTGLINLDESSRSLLAPESALSQEVGVLTPLVISIQEGGGVATIQLVVNRDTNTSSVVVEFNSPVTAPDGTVRPAGTILYRESDGGVAYLEPATIDGIVANPEIIEVTPEYQSLVQQRLDVYHPGYQAPNVGDVILARIAINNPQGERVTQALIADGQLLIFQARYVAGFVNIRELPTTSSADIGDLGDYPSGLQIYAEPELETPDTIQTLLIQQGMTYDPTFELWTKTQDGYTWTAILRPTEGVGEVLVYIALLDGSVTTQSVIYGPPTPEGISSLQESADVELSPEEIREIIENAPPLFDYLGNEIQLGTGAIEYVDYEGVGIPFYRQNIYGIMVGTPHEATIRIPDRNNVTQMEIDVVYVDFIISNDGEIRRFIFNNWDDGRTATERFSTQGEVARASFELQAYDTARIRQDILRLGQPYRITVGYLLPGQLGPVNAFIESYPAWNEALDKNSALMFYFGANRELPLPNGSSAVGYIGQIGYIPQ
jgi:hypothetical protein